MVELSRQHCTENRFSRQCRLAHAELTRKSVFLYSRLLLTHTQQGCNLTVNQRSIPCCVFSYIVLAPKLGRLSTVILVFLWYCCNIATDIKQKAESERTTHMDSTFKRAQMINLLKHHSNTNSVIFLNELPFSPTIDRLLRRLWKIHNPRPQKN